MHWDVVEVKPEANYCLLVRFKDGLSGRVQLDPREFTGVLSPLVDVEFFNRVYIDGGAPACPATSTWLPTLCTGRSLANETFASAPPELMLVVTAMPTSRS